MEGTSRIADQQQRLAEAREALQAAHATLQAGDPMRAFQDLLRITRFLGGEEGPLMRRAIEALSQGGGRNTEDLARLFEQCSLNLPPQDSFRDQGMSFSQAASMEHDHQEPSSSSNKPSNQHDPILAETGRESITGAALDDGSSFICSECGGVMSRSREAAHRDYWCSGAKGS